MPDPDVAPPHSRRSRAAALSPAIAALGARAAGMAGAFLLGAAILRSLPKADAGLALLFYTLVSVAATVGRFGADNLALREVSKSPATAAPFIGFCVRIAALASPPAALLLGAAFWARGGDARSPIVLAAFVVSVFPAALSVICGAILRGFGRIASGALAELGSPVLIAAVGIGTLGLLGQATVTRVVWALALGYLLTGMWSSYAVLRAIRSTARASAEATLHPLPLGEGLRIHGRSLGSFFLTTIGTYLFVWMPVLALGYVISEAARAQAQVSTFNAGARLAQFVAVLPTVQISYLSQRFALAHHEGDLLTVNSLAQRATKQALLASVAIGGFLLAAPTLALAVFGDYAEAAPTLRYLTLGAVLVAAFGPVNGLMLTCGLEHRASRYTLALLVVSACTLPFLTRWGSDGVAIGSSVISVAYAAACWIALQRIGIETLPIPHRRARAADTQP